MGKEAVKDLVMLSRTVDEADAQIEIHLGLKSIEEKVAFLQEMFDNIDIITNEGASNEMIYYIILYTIVGK